MSAIYESETNSIYVSAQELCSFIYRGGDLSSRPLMGNKNGGTVVSHRAWNKKPPIPDAYSFTTIMHGISVVVYAFPEWIRLEINPTAYTGDEPYSMIVVYENNSRLSAFSEYRIKEEDLPK